MSSTSRPIVAFAAGGLLLASLIGLSTPSVARGATHVVTIGDGFFSPAELAVSVGDTVTWVNEEDSPHTATGDGFDSGNIDPGESFSFTFAGAGTFGYVCAYHDEMTGSINVTAAAPSTVAASPATAPSPAGATAATTAEQAAGNHGAAHGGQPNTALVAPLADGAPRGVLATVLIGLALVAFAVAFLPRRAALPRPATRRRGGGWRR